MASALRRTPSRFGPMHPSVPDRGRADYVGVPLCHPSWGVALRVPVLEGEVTQGHRIAGAGQGSASPARRIFAGLDRQGALQIVKQLTGDSSLAVVNISWTAFR